MNFSDYLVFVDESGDAGLSVIDKDYPILTIAFVVIHKDDYVKNIVPAFTELKLRYWGHDVIVFHEHEIRKNKGDFAFLRTDKALRESFLVDLTFLVEKSNFAIISAVIDKNKFLVAFPKQNSSPYVFALGICIFHLHKFLKVNNQNHKTTEIIFESRGKNEDNLLELDFRRFRDDASINNDFRDFSINFKFADKKTNSIGLQLADLIARPIGINYLRPMQENRAFEIIDKKQHMKFVYS